MVSSYVGHESLPYHRMALVTARSSRWWRPLLMVVSLIGWAILALLVAGLVVLACGTVPGLPRMSADAEDPRNAMDVVTTYGAVALLLPVVLLTVRFGGGRPVGTVHSVAGNVRWHLVRYVAARLVPAFVLVNGVLFLVHRPDDFSAPTLSTWGWVALWSVLLVPWQAAAEEYLFRGLIPQMVGTWLRSPVWGALVATPLFVLGHAYDAWGKVDIGVFALCAAYLTWRTGGLEAAVVLHAGNNLSLALLSPLSPSSMQQGATDPWEVVVSVLLTLAATGWAVRLANRAGCGAEGIAQSPSATPATVRQVG